MKSLPSILYFFFIFFLSLLVDRVVKAKLSLCTSVFNFLFFTPVVLAGEKPYKCEYCPKSFHMLGHYQYHVRHHTGEKPYQCNTCGKAFSYSHNLNEHKNVHTGYRPYRYVLGVTTTRTFYGVMW